MMLLAFIPAFILWVIARVFPYHRLIIAFGVIFATLCIVGLIIDTRVYAMFKFHINSVVLSFVFSSQWQQVFDFSNYELLIIFSIVSLVIFFEAVLSWVLWKKIVIQRQWQPSKNIAIFWVGGMLFSYFTLILTMLQGINLFSQQIPILPLYSQLFAYVIPSQNAKDFLMRFSEQNFSQPLYPNSPMSYPLHPLFCEAPKSPYHIILIMVDSLRFDSVNSALMPNVSTFKQKGLQFQQHLSGGNATQPGVFSLFYSIPSNYWTAAIFQHKSPAFIDLLVKQGYETKVLWSAEMRNPPFDQTVYRGIKNISINGGAGLTASDWDRDTTQNAIRFLQSRKGKSPFFLNLFYDSVHGFCLNQNYPMPYQPIIKHCDRLLLSNEDDPKPYYNRYLNAVKFVDEEVGKVLQVIKDKGYLENSIVIFTSDHGQEFNDNRQNYWGHSGNFTRAQTQVPMIIYWPGVKPRSIDYATSHYDFVPTMLKRLFLCKNAISDYSIGQDLLLGAGRKPFLLVGSYSNMGIIESDRLTTLETSGRVMITDPHAVPLDQAMPRMDIINQALALMRRYFDTTASDH